MNAIVLTGFKGSGKTTVGRLLAARLGRRFVDLDDVLTRIHGEESDEDLSYREVFERHGAEEFRDLERRAAERLLDFERSRPQFGVPSDTIPLHSLVPDPSMFPVEAFRRAVNRAFADLGASLLAYGGPQGFAGLREVLADRFHGFGVIVGPDSVVLSSGASQGISLAMRLFAESGDAVAIEAPTYHNALATMIGLDLKAAPVPMRPTGPDLDALDRQLSRPEVKAWCSRTSATSKKRKKRFRWWPRPGPMSGLRPILAGTPS